MLRSGDYLINQLLVPLFLWIFILGGFVGIALGLGLVFRSAQTLRLLGGMNRWVSFRAKMKPMEQPRDMDKAVYLRRHWIGGAFVLSGAFIVYMLLFKVRFASLMAALSADNTRVMVELIVDSVRWFLVAGGVLAIVIGAMLMFAPDALRALESRTNHWHSSRQLGKGGDTMRLTLDQWAESFPRTTGILIAIGSAMLLIAWYVVSLGD